MDETRTQDRTEQYVGPSALRIANLHAAPGQLRAGLVLDERRPSATAASRTGWRSGSDRTATA